MIKKGVYCNVHSPMVMGEKYLFDIQRFESLNCESQAVGGFWTASIALNLNYQQANDWYENGLGRVIKVYDHQGKLAWEGFTNQVTLATGTSTEVRGPLLSSVNRTFSTYTPRDFTVYPPVDGSQTVTLIVEDLFSQEQFGILEEAVSAGTTTEMTAIKARDRFLAENRYPKTTSDISISPGNASPLSVTLDLLGKVHWLMVFIYENATPGTSYLSNKLKAILNADPNNVVSTDYSNITDNLYLVDDVENKMRKGWDIISELLSLGDAATDARYLFGVYENGVPYFNKVPTTIDYIYKLSASRQLVKNYVGGGIVYPWNVRPGRWITTSDLLLGRMVPSTNLDQDVRNKFIESVRFSSPWSVDLSNGATDRLSQMLAKITYSGGLY